jgi:hypothetical protein
MSPKIPVDTSLERLVALMEAHNPNFSALLNAATEEAFIAATDGAIERAVGMIESGAKDYSALDEPGLSKLLTDFLSSMGFQSTPERNVNGHVDVVVEHLFGGRWKYLGECKIHHGFQYHVDGCEQLLGYCTGRERRAFCLDFFRTAGMYQKLVELRDRMDKERPLAQNALSANHSIKGAFVTNHTHVSGSDVELLHLGCSVPK